MLINILQATWIARSFMLIFLLISASTTHASFWCHEPGRTAHLMSNPVGECWAASSHAESELRCADKITETSVFFSTDEDDCIDSPVCSSVLTSSNRTSPLSKITTSDIALIATRFNNPTASGIVSFSHLPLASRLPHPQALTALRTVILRH
ncbi:hypothetical protein SAMN05660420_02255 [Desulfuromusa kysingii]|uniref:Uncharacterized protein n=1 Tax=Desulfuromusa kysingii TaxID=37625 RepID=A0A1H4BKN4_9BACT|nr:hypothetical protein SAMN05660420_02255 [Desulfuromusa kysingii]